ncbi:hypothetical protein IB285_14120 [Erythrobacter sp. KMU-140]|uniref:Uncharacterized protein n=2 Tax=Erythrobacter rubeus TaxID=2760803 RepID=A0ABR8KWD0_9SPHN|nr:hypothetical protein [Erythrobacter rubeus]
MEIHPQILIFAVSLAAIVALSGLAVLLRLGGEASLADEGDAIQAASEVQDGFDAVDLAISEDGAGAVLSDAQGQIMIIKRHGNRFAGRLLGPGADAVAEGTLLTVNSGERRFGSITLHHPNAASWADAINRLKNRGNA